MTEWLLALLITFNVVVIVPLLIRMYSENKQLRRIVSEYQHKCKCMLND